MDIHLLVNQCVIFIFTRKKAFSKSLRINNIGSMTAMKRTVFVDAMTNAMKVLGSTQMPSNLPSLSSTTRPQTTFSLTNYSPQRRLSSHASAKPASKAARGKAANTAKPAPMPSQKGLLDTVANLNPSQKLYFALGWFAFALAGVFATYKLEEAFPAPKRPSISAPSSATGSTGPVEARSQFDLLLAEETEAQLMAMKADENA
ncbi:hypothetical protein BC830DRAFT_85652 [Chytriomyces sp. MP71]|nr:hypothetical protein BC830DRAFT_85652 [Chytriomyces sp. MP71]